MARAGHRDRVTLRPAFSIACRLVFALALALVVVLLPGCKSGGGSSAADTDWGRIAEDEGWPSLSDEEFDELLDSFVEENAAFATQVQTPYIEPMAIVIGSTAEDPENWGAEPHLVAFDGTPEGPEGAMRELGGMVARSGQRPLAILLIAEADAADGTVLPGASADATAAAQTTPADRALLTIGMTVDGRLNKAVQILVTDAAGTVTVEAPSEVVHAAEGGDVPGAVLMAFYEGYVEGRSE